MMRLLPCLTVKKKVANGNMLVLSAHGMNRAPATTPHGHEQSNM